MTSFLWYLIASLLLLLFIIVPSLQNCDVEDANTEESILNEYESYRPSYSGYPHSWSSMGRYPMQRPSSLLRPYNSYYNRPFGVRAYLTKCTNIDINNYTCPTSISHPYHTNVYTTLITDSQILKLPSDFLNECTEFAEYIIYLRIEDVSLETIEPGAFTNFERLGKLSLDRNNFKEIKNDYFKDMRKQLTTLTMGFNEIETINTGAFENLSLLQSLNLEYNLISSLNSNDTFEGLNELMILNLSNNMLKVIEKDIFDKLPRLQFLDLTANKINQIDPDAFSLNRYLETIVLPQNFLLDIKGLNLPNATTNLNVSHNTIHDVDFATLQNVEVIDLSSNTFAFDIKNPVPRMMLKTLKCDHNEISNIKLASKLFDQLKDLQYLDLASNNLKTFDILLLENMKQLKNLSLTNNQLESLNFQNVSNQLEGLDVSENNLKSIDGISHLSNLKYLNLDKNKLIEITLNMFAGLTNLQTLTIRDNDIASLQMGCFKDLKKLKRLDLSGNDISVLEIGIFSGLPLTALGLSRNLLTNFKEGILHSDHELVYLDISYNKINATNLYDMLEHLKTTYTILNLDIQGNDWKCEDILKVMKPGNTRIRIKLIPGDETNVTNVQGIGCTDDNQLDKPQGSALNNNLNLGETDKLLVSQSENLDRISDKLATGNTFIVLIFVLLAAMCLAKCIPTSYVQKTGLFRWKRSQGMELLPESGYENNI